jgi:ABC-type transport system involved in multi-copper enzyme maturation permease subunit
VTNLASELLKLRTTRAPYVLLGVAALASGLVAAALTGVGELDGAQQDRALTLAQGAAFWGVLATVLGILVVTNEYRHGTIMTTFLAEPRRARVLAAKLVTSLIGGAVLALGALIAAAAVAVPWLAVRDEPSLFGGQAVEAVGRLLLAFALSAGLGAAVGAMIQNQVGAIIAVFVWFLILESIIGIVSGLVFGDFGEPDPVTPYLPGTALGGIVGGDQGSQLMLEAGPSILLALGYVIALAVLGALSMTRRDP